MGKDFLVIVMKNNTKYNPNPQTAFLKLNDETCLAIALRLLKKSQLF